MKLYHYRSIDSAIKEIENQTFHFSSREEVNDPLEGYVRVFWQGDQAAWEGLLRNYVCSVFNEIEYYLAAGDLENQKHPFLLDIHAFDDVPLGEILRKLGDKFLENPIIQEVVNYCGRQGRRLYSEELTIILRLIHEIALILCIETNRDLKTVPDEECEHLLKGFEQGKELTYKTLHTMLSAENKRAEEIKLMAQFCEDMFEERVLMASETDMRFYGNRDDSDGINHTLKEAVQRRDWLFLKLDYPKTYIRELQEMIYPKGYMVCFSKQNNNSAMWGNYADNHRGVCLVYETDSDQCISVNNHKHCVKAVTYDARLLERNFFETVGRLTHPQFESWLTGRDGISQCYKKIVRDLDDWRERYWEAFDAKYYQKIKAWEHEQEYRIVLNDMLDSYDKPEDRNLPYNPEHLTGVIFGVRTSEYDKKRIMESLKKVDKEKNDYYQVVYEEELMELSVRRKLYLRLRD